MFTIKKKKIKKKILLSKDMFDLSDPLSISLKTATGTLEKLTIQKDILSSKLKAKKKKKKKAKKIIMTSNPPAKLVNDTTSDYKGTHCPSCCNQAFSVVKIKREPETLTPKEFQVKSCKRCGNDISFANYVRFCTNCKSYATCMNCVVCPSGHSAHKSEDVSIGFEDKGSLYTENKYNCDSCSTVKNVRPYIWRCRVCEWDVCPQHVYGVTHVWESTIKLEKLKKGVRYVWDPFWDRYAKKAEELGADYERVGKCVKGAKEVC